METNNNKVITVSFMIAGVLAGYIAAFVLNTVAASTSGSVARTLSLDYIRHGVPILVGILTFLSLQFRKPVVDWADEVVAELRKIVWPSQKDTMNMTIVVCIMVLISGVVLGLFDFAASNVIDALINMNFQSIF
jgi:preprotein translocase SecE subunit